jgi:hypothetical protein
MKKISALLFLLTGLIMSFCFRSIGQTNSINGRWIRLNEAGVYTILNFNQSTFILSFFKSEKKIKRDGGKYHFENDSTLVLTIDNKTQKVKCRIWDSKMYLTNPDSATSEIKGFFRKSFPR